METTARPARIQPQRGDHRVTCAYCYVEAWQHLDVPAIDDDDEWKREARQHYADCEWVLTRAHRIGTN